MIETIYIYKGKYPFNSDYAPGNTFLQVTQQYDCELAIQKARQNCIILKKVLSEHLIRLTRILKEDNVLHLVYEYFDGSLQEHIKQKIKSEADLNSLMDSVGVFVQAMVKVGVKTGLFLENMAFDMKNGLKIFVHPSFEIVQGKTELAEFYYAEEKRLQIQIEQIYQSVNGKIVREKGKASIKKPNFVINGNALVFSQAQEANKVQKKPFEDMSCSVKSKESAEASLRLSEPQQLYEIGLCKNESQNFKDVEEISPTMKSKSRQESTIKRSKELLEKAKNQLLGQSRTQNPDSNGLELEINEIKEVTEPKGRRESTRPSQSVQIQHQESSREEKPQAVILADNMTSSSGKTQSRKLKMKITTFHEIQVQAADIQKIKQEILEGDGNILPQNLLGHNSKITQFVTEPSHDFSPIPKVPQVSISEKVRLAKEKADLVLRKRKQ